MWGVARAAKKNLRSVFSEFGGIALVVTTVAKFFVGAVVRAAIEVLDAMGKRSRNFGDQLGSSGWSRVRALVIAAPTGTGL
jgi:ABC-type sulfate transport system permease subunit